MPHRSIDSDPVRDDALPGVIGHPFPQPATVVVVSRSQVNLIVLSRIVERARLRAFACGPEHAGALIGDCDPLMIILDGGSDMRDCDAALEPIALRKRLSGGTRPHVVLLTMQNMRPEPIERGGLIDSLVAKPVTPERLQPLIETVRDRRS